MENKEIKIKGSIKVNFTISSDQVSEQELIEFLKAVLERELAQEWQNGKALPDMTSLRMQIEK